MLPEGGAHVPCMTQIIFMLRSFRLTLSLLLVKGAAKIAKKLGFDYAEAVVCLFPVVTTHHSPVYTLLDGLRV